MRATLEELVRRRAGHTCEYCRFSEESFGFPFVLDHIIAQQHGGKTVKENLALCCGFCNAHKGPNIAGVDPVTGDLTALFHPRRDHWDQHFRLDRDRLIGLTAVGRVTIYVLAMNDKHRRALRRTLIEEGFFPP